MNVLVAVDPSILSCGVAVFVDGELLGAESVKAFARPDDNLAARSLAMARQVWHRVREAIPTQPVRVATEWPQVYRAQRAAGDPNALPTMAAVGTAVAALLQATEVLCCTPAEWAGQVPKATKGDCKDSPRARRIRSRLLASTAEIAAWEALRRSDHDAIDAIGIGLHFLGRLH